MGFLEACLGIREKVDKSKLKIIKPCGGNLTRISNLFRHEMIYNKNRL